MIQTKMMKKQKYEAPSLTVVEFMTERGFAFSLQAEQALNELTTPPDLIYQNQYIAAGFSQDEDASSWSTNGWGVMGNGSGTTGNWF